MKKIIYNSTLLVFSLVISSSLFADDFSTHYLNRIGDPQQQVTRDPFSPSALMYEVLNKQSVLGRNTGGYGVARNSLKIPKMKLRGFIEKNGSETLALLDINGFGTQLVREGDEITFDPTQPHNKITITEINSKGVVADMGMLGSFRILK